MRRTCSLLLLPFVLAATACHPTCKQVCKKLLGCEEVENARINQEECEDACDREEALYEDWDNSALLDAFYAQNKCIYHASCEEIAAGDCADDDLLLYKESGGSDTAE